MRLNGGAFNAQAVNGSRRAPVYASAIAAAGLLAEGEGRVEVRGQGVTAVRLGGALQPSARRLASGCGIQVDIQALCGASRRRVGGGTAAVTLDTTPLNYQLWRRGFGIAPLTFDAALSPRAFRGLDAGSLIRLRAEIALSARRFAPLHAELRAQAQLAPTVYRVASARRNANSLGLLASLYYSRIQYGNGSAALTLAARADVGVQFLSGVGALQPMVAELAPNRRRWVASAAPIHLSGAFSPSAMRRMAASPTFELRTHAELDPAHITAAGVRYITPDLRATVSTYPVDGGMYRRLTAGAFHPARVEVGASGSLRRGRTFTISRGGTSLLAQAEFISTRPFPTSPALLGFGATGSGEVLVRGSGAATFKVGAALHGRLANFISGVAPTTVVAPTLTPLVYRGGRGAAVSTSVRFELSAARRRVGRAFVILPTVLQEGEAVIYRVGSSTVLLGLLGRGQGEALVYGDGAAVLRVASQLTGQVVRFLDGEGPTTFEASGQGAILVRGAGRLPVALGAELGAVRSQFLDAEAALTDIECGGTWVVPAREHLGTLLTTLDIELERVRWARDLPALMATIDARGAGLRRVTLNAEARVEVLGESEAYINIFSEDVDTQTFVRPAELRAQTRAPEERTFLRTL